MRTFAFVLGSSFSAALFVACVGSDATPAPEAPDRGIAASSSGSSTSGGATSPTPDTGAPATNDAATDAPADTGPTCKPAIATCVDTFNSHRMNKCDPDRATCQASCTSSPSPCVSACKDAWTTCMQGFQQDCLSCERAGNACDPETDCYFPPP